MAIDLFCGLGGWAEGFLAEGYDVIGFDIEARPYPGQLVLQDVLTLHGAQFKDVVAIVASPPCQKYSYMAMPWKRAKDLAAWYRESSERIGQLNALFDACFRIQREASEAAGHEIPMVIENVKGAQPWVGRARWHYGSFYLWGDVPALMPMNVLRNLKYGCDCSSRIWKHRAIPRVAQRNSTRDADRAKDAADIAKIPFTLSQHIAACFKPTPTASTRTSHPNSETASIQQQKDQ
jgi:hypothetical protein